MKLKSMIAALVWMLFTINAFAADPEVWRIVDGKLYLNLDTTIQDLWLADTDGMIETADANWKDIEATDPAKLL